MHIQHRKQWEAFELELRELIDLIVLGESHTENFAGFVVIEP